MKKEETSVIFFCFLFFALKSDRGKKRFTITTNGRPRNCAGNWPTAWTIYVYVYVCMYTLWTHTHTNIHAGNWPATWTIMQLSLLRWEFFSVYVHVRIYIHTNICILVYMYIHMLNIHRLLPRWDSLGSFNSHKDLAHIFILSPHQILAHTFILSPQLSAKRDLLPSKET